MRAAVLGAWRRFSDPFEGVVHSMYLDVKRLITTGCGNLIDASQGGGPNPWTPALALPFKHADGRAATHGEIRDAWLALKAHVPDLSKRHWKFAAALNDLRLTDADIDELVERKLLENERELRKAFPAWDSWCADAQLGALSMSWAVGPGFPRIFKNFTRAANAEDWVAAKATCKIRYTDAEGKVNNPGVIPRNRANELCFGNAAIVKENALDPERLFWPDVAGPDTALAETQPPPTPNVTGIVAETARQMREENRDDETAARDAEVKEP